MENLNDAVLELQKTLAEKGGLDNYIKEVVKATNNSTGFSTRQSLSKQVADLTIRRTPFLDLLATEDVINPIHQWDAITALSVISSFAGPIDTIGNDADPTITRFSENVRYYRTTTTVGQFTQAMSRPELRAQETVDEKAIQAIRYDLEGDLWVGGAGADNVRGVDNVISSFSPASHIVSNLNAALSSTSHIDDLMKSMVTVGSVPTHVFFNPSDLKTFNTLFVNNVRYNEPQKTSEFGYAVRKYLSPFGEIDVLWDLFIPAKSGAPAVSTAYVLDMQSMALGEPTVNGAKGIAMQDLAKTGPQNVKLLNWYGLFIYRNTNGLAKLTNIG